MNTTYSPIILPTPNSNIIKYIYHISDIHIRNHTRHDEYRSVFNRLYKQLLLESGVRNQTGLIVLTGDIVHSKSQISPQLIIELKDFLTNLSNILPVIMIAGNHDLNLSNPSIPDTLSSILHRIMIPNLHYLKDSGIYIWNNITFSVMSVLNYPLIKSEELPSNIFKIGLLHATINGSKITTSSMELTSDKYKISDLTGYDFVLLGDIHLHQYMNPEHTIAYAGSLIQQSFGEELYNHGYLRWDLYERSSKLVEIYNDYGFINLYLKNNKLYPENLIKTLLNNDVKMPRKLYLKIAISDESDIEIAEKFLVDLSNKEYEFIQQLIIPFTRNVSLDNINLNNKTNNLLPELDNELPNITNVEYQKKLLKDYLVEDDQSKLTKIYELHDKFSKQINNIMDNNNLYRWEIMTLEFQNVFSFIDKNFIDFTNFNGIVGVIGPNFSGKSNLIDILLFALFDHSSRGERNDIITSNQNSMYIKLKFRIGSVCYFIDRIGTINNTKNGDKYKIDVKFYSDLEDLTGENRLQTNKNIQNIVGTYDDFVLTTLKLQESHNGNLITLSNSQRKERLVDLLRLNILDEYYKIGYNQFKDNKKVLEIYQKELQQLPTDLSTHMNVVIDMLLKEKTKMNILRRKLDQAQIELNNYSGQIQPVDMNLVNMKYVEIPVIDVSNIKEMDKVLTQINEKIVKLEVGRKKLNYDNMSLSELEENVDIYSTTIIDHETKITEEEKKENNMNLILNELQNNRKQYKINLKDWDKKLTQKIELKQWLNRVRENNKKLLHLEYDAKCRFCMNNIFVQDAIKCRDELVNKEKELETLEIEINELEGIKSELDSVDKEINQIQETLNKRVVYHMEKELNTWKQELEHLREDYRNLRSNQKADEEIKSLKQKRDKVQDDRDVLWEMFEKSQLMKEVKIEQTKYQNNKGVRERIEQLNKDINKMKEDKNILDENIMKKSTEEQLLIVKLDHQNKLNNQIQFLREENNLLEVYCQAFNKDGIPKFLIEKYLPEFEQVVNIIMDDLVKFKIKMDISDKKWNLYVVYNDRQLNIDLCSGYEKFVVGIAIKCALSHMSQMSQPQFMVIDEGFGTLDNNNLGEIGRILNFLRSKYKFVLLITHIDNIKDELDSQLEIIRTGNYSHVNNKKLSFKSASNNNKISLKIKRKSDSNSEGDTQ